MLRSFRVSFLMFAFASVPCLLFLSFFLLVRRPPLSSLFPYTTLFRSALLDPLHRAADLAHELLVRCGLHLQTLNRRGRSRAILLRLRDHGPRRGVQVLAVETLRELAEPARDLVLPALDTRDPRGHVAGGRGGRRRGCDPLQSPRRLLVHDLHEPRELLLLLGQRGDPRILRLDGGEDRGQQLHRLRTAELLLRLHGPVLLLQPVECCAHVPAPSAAGGSRRTPARPPG